MVISEMVFYFGFFKVALDTVYQWCSPWGKAAPRQKLWCLCLMPATSVFHWLVSASEKLPWSRPHCLCLTLVDIFNG